MLLLFSKTIYRIILLYLTELLICVYHNLSQGKKELVDPFAVVAFAGHKV